MNMNALCKVIYLKPLVTTNKKCYVTGRIHGWAARMFWSYSRQKNITKVTDLIFIIQQLGQLRNGAGCKISIILQVVKKML